MEGVVEIVHRIIQNEAQGLHDQILRLLDQVSAKSIGVYATR